MFGCGISKLVGPKKQNFGQEKHTYSMETVVFYEDNELLSKIGHDFSK